MNVIPSLKDMVDEYIKSERENDITYVSQFKTKSKTLTYGDYVEKALTEFMFDHKWNVRRFKKWDSIKLAGLHIKTHEGIIRGAKSFDELIKFISKPNIKYFNELAQYDAALALGTYPDLMPDKVFVHAGPSKALKRIDGGKHYLKVRKLNTKIKYIEVCDLPTEFDSLKNTPYLIEMCLCYIWAKYYKIEEKCVGRGT